MAGQTFTVSSEGEVALVAATIKTICQVAATSTGRLLIHGFYVAFDGIVLTNEPVIVVLQRQTSAGTSSAGTPVKDKDNADALQVTSRITFTAEPSLGDVVRRKLVHPAGGQYEVLFMLDKPIEIGFSDRIGLSCTAGVAVNAVGEIYGEE